MKTALAVIAVIVAQLTSPRLILAQAAHRVLVAELQFNHDSTGTPTLKLETGQVYWAELDGRGTPVLKAVANGRDAFLVPVDEGREPLRFQVYPTQSGLHAVSLIDPDSTGTVTLRLYHDIAESERVRKIEDKSGGIWGFLIAGGAHSGLGLDSVAGAAPKGGSAFDACVLLQSGDRFATCVGGTRQYMPDEDYVAGWVFLEERARLFTATPLGSHHTDVGVSLRLSKSMGVNGRNDYPGMLSYGLHVRQHLASGGRRRGVSLLASWQHGAIKGTTTSKDPSTDQFTAGLVWIP